MTGCLVIFYCSDRSGERLFGGKRETGNGKRETGSGMIGWKSCGGKWTKYEDYESCKEKRQPEMVGVS
jgi:hypothetical protein